MKKAARRTGKPSRRPVIMFLVRCLAYWGVALWAVSRFPAIEDTGVSLTLKSLQLVLGVFGEHVQRSGAYLSVGSASVQIVSDCSPHMPFLIFAAVVLAFPSSWKQRLVGLLFGAVIIHVFNTVRIMALLWILAVRQSWFDFAHVYLWQTGTILIVFATFALWIRALTRGPKPA